MATSYSLDYFVAEEFFSFLIPEVSWSDIMGLTGMSGGLGPNPLPVHLQVKLGLHLGHVLACHDSVSGPTAWMQYSNIGLT